MVLLVHKEITGLGKIEPLSYGTLTLAQQWEPKIQLSKTEFSLFVIVLFYEVTSNTQWGRTGALLLWEHRLGSCKSLVTSFLSVNQGVTWFCGLLCQMLYLIKKGWLMNIRLSASSTIAHAWLKLLPTASLHLETLTVLQHDVCRHRKQQSHLKAPKCEKYDFLTVWNLEQESKAVCQAVLSTCPQMWMLTWGLQLSVSK